MSNFVARKPKIVVGIQSQSAKVVMLEAKTDNSIDESLFTDEKPKSSNRHYTALDRKGTSIRQTKLGSWLGPLGGDSKPNVLIDVKIIKPLITVHVMAVHASVASSKSKVELDSNAYKNLDGDICLVIHDNDKLKKMAITLTEQSMQTEIHLDDQSSN